MPTQALTDLSIANAPKTPKVGDVRSKRGGYTTYYTKNNLKTPARTETPVITPESLKPAAAPVVSPTPTLTEVPKLQADLMTQQEDALAQKVAADKTAAEASKGTALDAYLKTLSESKGLSTLQAEAYAAPGGVNAITPELNDINDQIRREQRSLDLAKRRIQESGGGLEAGAIAEQQNLERVSLQKQADLSIIQMAVQGRYDSAKEIADRAVAAQFEEQTKKTDIAKFDYEENKDLFTKAEQREYDLLFADRTAKLEEAKQNKQSIYELGIQASADGAPSSVVQRMMAAKTREEALGIGGSYIGALDRAAKNASIRSANASAAASETNRLLDLAEKGDPAAIEKLNFDPRSTTGNFEAESNLRKEFNALPAVKEAVSVQQSYKSINAALQEAQRATQSGGSPAAADQALIISFNKMLDPNSVVREGEFARSTQGQAYLDQIKAKVDAAMRGGAGLTDQMRQEIVNTTGVLYSDYIRTHNDTAYDFRQNAKRQGGDPNYVAGYIDTTTPPDQAQDGDILVINGIPMEKQGDQFIPLDI